MKKGEKYKMMSKEKKYSYDENKELLDKFPVFLKNIGREDQIKYAESIIACDSDKCEQYRVSWENEGIPYIHGVMIYLITKFRPYSDEARVTISPSDFVIKRYGEFKTLIPE